MMIFLTIECFQRGSLKDEIIVWAFIISVVCLLGVMVLRPYIGGKIDKNADIRPYEPISPR
jgi:hypothetical protein